MDIPPHERIRYRSWKNRKTWEAVPVIKLNLAFAAAAIGIAAAINPVSVQAKEVRIVIGASGDGALQRGMRLFAKKIEEKSGGNYTGKVFEGTLLNYSETTKGLSTGVAEVGYMVPAYVRGEFPLTNYGIDIVATIVEPVAVGAAMSEFIYTCKPCLKEFKRKNQVFMGFSVVSSYVFMSKKLINDLSELKGMRIRGFSAFNKLVGQWGAAAVSVPVSEVYQALSSGHIEGNIHLWDIIKSYSLGDHVKYVYDTPIGIYGGNSMFNTNLDFWKSLSTENKRNFISAAAESLAFTTVEYTANDRKLANNAAELKVKEVKTPDSIRKSIIKFRENNINDVLKAAETNDKIPNAKELGKHLLSLVEKWRGLVKGIDQTNVDAVAKLYRDNLFNNIDLSSLE